MIILGEVTRLRRGHRECGAVKEWHIRTKWEDALGSASRGVEQQKLFMGEATDCARGVAAASIRSQPKTGLARACLRW